MAPLGLTAATSKTDTAIRKKIFESGTTTLITSNEEMDDIMKIVKSLEEPCLLKKNVDETNHNEAKEQKEGFLSTLLGTLGANLLWNLLIGKGVKRSKIPGQGVMRTGENIFN